MSARTTQLRLASDEGAVAVMVAISFIVIIAFVALIVDVGLAVSVDGRLQSAVDASALAACQKLIQTSNPTVAEVVARDYVRRHASGLIAGISDAEIEVDASFSAGVPSVTVRASRTVPLAFGGAIGRPEMTASAVSKAEGQRLWGARYVSPYAIVVPGEVRNVRYEVRNAANAIVRQGPLTHLTGQTWTASIDAPDTPGRFDVLVRYENESGVAETLYDTRSSRPATACVLFTRGAGQPVESVSANGPLFVEWRNLIFLDSPTYYAPTVTSTIGGVTLSTLRDPGRNHNGDIHFMTPVVLGGQTVAYLHARRSDAPIKNVSVSPVVADPGAPVALSVEFTGSDHRRSASTGGRLMYMRPAPSNAQYSGDYVELDLSGLSHDACGADPFDTAGVSGMTATEWRRYGYPAPLHVGDEAPTFASVSNPGLAGYQRLREAAGVQRYAIAPVVVRLSANRVRIVGFAPLMLANMNSTFIEYRCSGHYSSAPHGFEAGTAVAGSNGVMAPRLVQP